MKIVKNKDLIYSKQYDLELYNYLDKVISVYASVYMKPSNTLTKSQKKFYIASIVLNQLKVSLKSKEALNYFNKFLLIRTKSDVAHYLRKLTAKGWYNKIGDDFILPEFCNDLKSVKFIVQINNEQEEVN